jgi:hypothetical protein
MGSVERAVNMKKIRQPKPHGHIRSHVRRVQGRVLRAEPILVVRSVPNMELRPRIIGPVHQLLHRLLRPSAGIHLLRVRPGQVLHHPGHRLHRRVPQLPPGPLLPRGPRVAQQPADTVPPRGLLRIHSGKDGFTMPSVRRGILLPDTLAATHVSPGHDKRSVIHKPAELRVPKGIPVCLHEGGAGDGKPSHGRK